VLEVKFYSCWLNLALNLLHLSGENVTKQKDLISSMLLWKLSMEWTGWFILTTWDGLGGRHRGRHCDVRAGLQEW